MSDGYQWFGAIKPFFDRPEITIPVLFFPARDTAPFLPFETIFNVRILDNKNRLPPTEIGTVQNVYRYVKGFFPGPTPHDPEGSEIAWREGVSYDQWMAGQLTQKRCCEVMLWEGGGAGGGQPGFRFYCDALPPYPTVVIYAVNQQGSGVVTWPEVTLGYRLQPDTWFGAMDIRFEPLPTEPLGFRFYCIDLHFELDIDTAGGFPAANSDFTYPQKYVPLVWSGFIETGSFYGPASATVFVSSIALAGQWLGAAGGGSALWPPIIFREGGGAGGLPNAFSAFMGGAGGGSWVWISVPIIAGAGGGAGGTGAVSPYTTLLFCHWGGKGGLPGPGWWITHLLTEGGGAGGGAPAAWPSIDITGAGGGAAGGDWY